MEDFGSAVILCGGKSIRMGFDKSSLKIKNKYLIEIIGEQLERVFKDIVLVSNDIDKFKDIRYTVVQDIISGSGPMGAIYTALKNASSKYVFVTACDMPVVNLEYIDYMINLIREKNVEGVVSYKSKYIEPLYAFYSKNMLNTFEKQIARGQYKLLDVIKGSRIQIVEEDKLREYCKDMDIFTNLNFKSDLNLLDKIFKGGTYGKYEENKY